MLKLLGGFLILQCFYHILVTVLWYGTQLVNPSLFAIMRDILWIVISLFLFFWRKNSAKAYFKSRWKLWIGMGVLLLFGIWISFFYFSKTPESILIGIKYGLWRMIILLVMSIRGFSLREKWKNLIPFFYQGVRWGLVFIVIGGRIRQLGKWFFPEQFFALWYGMLDDFHFGIQPPLYYLTGFEGTLRRQGIFAWPNNYWYFLVLFLPLIFLFFQIQKQKTSLVWIKKNWLAVLIRSLWLFTLGMTLSRTALIGAMMVIILMATPFFRRNKKLLFCTLGGISLIVISFSLLKWESTLAHLQAKWSGIEYVIQSPFGYGLGSSWPAVHHSGTLLPENYYLQIMLDLGTVGFLLWCGVMGLFGYQWKIIHSKISKTLQSSDKESQILFALEKGFLAFLVMGIFLHVFEDSMVNYLFFSLYGLLLWYCSAVGEEV